MVGKSNTTRNIPERKSYAERFFMFPVPSASDGPREENCSIPARKAALKPGFIPMSYKQEWNRVDYASGALRIGDFFFGGNMFAQLKEDIACFKAHDPAARSALEILLLYPGLKAIRMHRRAYWFWNHGMPFIARWISQKCSRRTGIEIHPAVKIGKRFCIDHGTGIVIGETTEIGDDVMLYQGVTLGGTGKDTGKRHPTICNNVMIGAGARVLGPVVIGNNTRIGSGAVVLENIPENCTAVGVPAKVVKSDGVRVDDLDQIHITDPVQQEINRLEDEINKLKKIVEEEKKP